MEQTITENQLDVAAVLQAYARAFEYLSPESLHSELAPLLAADIYFEDPFNQLHNKQQTLHLFEHMFATVQHPQFIVLDYALSGSQDSCGYLSWQFSFVYNAKKQQFDGLSKVRINPKGLICSHIDYWDPAKHIYSHIPLLGWLLNKVKNKLALPA
ncbi:SnoaL-like domain-containing protein [uncultured Thiomicrorhabdus sp.]